MQASIISFNGSEAFRLAHPIDLPNGWVELNIGVGHVAMPESIARQVGVPAAGHHPFFAPRLAVQWPPRQVAAAPNLLKRPHRGGCLQVCTVKPEFGGGYLYAHTDENERNGALPLIHKRLPQWSHDERFHWGCEER